MAAAANGEAWLALAPAPGLGFSGGAALDADGRFAGIAVLKPAVVAGASSTTPSLQATLVPAESVRSFLASQGVRVDGKAREARLATVRVICVRK